jgi:hypothetical protein
MKTALPDLRKRIARPIPSGPVPPMNAILAM